MRKFLVLLPLMLLPFSTFAQQTPTWVVFGGYSNLTANFNASNFYLNGVNLSVTENMNSWFGGVLDFSDHFGTDNGVNTDMQTLTYGPVFSYRKAKRVVPFGHGLLGVVRGGPGYLDISKPEYRFCAYAGGGLDVQVTRNVALRLIQADYLMTRFSNTRQDNVRLSAGIVLLLGKKQ